MWGALTNMPGDVQGLYLGVGLGQERNRVQDYQSPHKYRGTEAAKASA